MIRIFAAVGFIVYTLVSANAKADVFDRWDEWLPVRGGENSMMYYTTVDVMQHGEQTSFIVYADQTMDCDVQGALLSVSDTDEFDSSMEMEANGFQLKVDKNTLWTLLDAETEISAKNGRLRVKVRFGIGDKFLSQIVTGKNIKARVMFLDDDEWTGTMNFPLKGSRRRVNELMSACSKHDDSEWEDAGWDADDWEKNISENEWES